MPLSSEGEEEDFDTPRQSIAFSLRYPTIPVHGTPDSWLAQSQIVSMASYRDDSSVCSFDDTSSSVGDNSYVYIENGSDMTTDDEDHSQMAQSISSMDGPQGQQAEPQSLEQPHTAGATRAEQSKEPWASHSLVRRGSSGSDIQTRRTESAPEKSTQDLDQTIKAAEGRDQAHQAIKFIESPNGEGYLKLRDFDGLDVPQILHQADLNIMPEQISVTVRQDMARKTLAPTRPFKVFFIGDASSRESIQHKIATALAVDFMSERRKSSGSMVVPIPSSSNSTGQDVVLIEKTDIDIAVDHCFNASFIRKSGGYDTIGLTMAGDNVVESSWDGSKFCLSQGWQLPDIAVFCLSGTDNINTKQTRRFARSFMNRHDVPSIVISQTLSWDRPADAMALDHKTPHICLEASAAETSKSRILKRLPIDLSSFLNIDPSQMNRNLALLAGRHRSPSPSKKHPAISKEETSYYAAAVQNYATFFDTLRQILGNTMHNIAHQSRPHLIQNIFLVSMLLLVGSFLSQRMVSLDPSRVSNVDLGGRFRGHGALENPSPTITALVLSSDSTLKLKTPSSLAISAKISKSLAAPQTNTDLASFILDTPARTLNKSERFKVHVIGNSHVVLRPPFWFTQTKKSPKLYFNITQGKRVLAHQVSKLFDGVYAVELSSNDAHGSLSIAVWTNSRPRINETFQVEFEKPWFQAVDFQKAASVVTSSLRHDVGIVQTGLSAFYDRSRSEMTSLMSKIGKRADTVQKEIKRLSSFPRSSAYYSTHLAWLQSRKTLSELSETLDYIRNQTLKQTLSSVNSLRCGFASRVGTRSSLAARQIQTLVGMLASSNRKVGVLRIKEYSTIYLRQTQKKALKLWWSVSGLPKQRPVKVVVSKKKMRMNR